MTLQEEIALVRATASRMEAAGAPRGTALACCAAAQLVHRAMVIGIERGSVLSLEETLYVVEGFVQQVQSLAPSGAKGGEQADPLPVASAELGPGQGVDGAGCDGEVEGP